MRPFLERTQEKVDDISLTLYAYEQHLAEHGAIYAESEQEQKVVRTIIDEVREAREGLEKAAKALVRAQLLDKGNPQ